MTINLETQLKHMKWANHGIYSSILELPEESLNAYVTNSDWNVAEILGHIVGAADRYAARLNGRKPNQINLPKSMLELKDITEKLALYDSELIELSGIQDRVIEVNREGAITHWQASTILSQSIHHATEHRCQAVTALEFRGFKSPNLDDYDHWSYETSLKSKD